MNTFYHGDCLFVMNHDIEPNSIDLIYLDPPFFTGKVQKVTKEWQPGAMEVSYEDSKRFWGNSERVNAMRLEAPEWLKHIANNRPDFASYLYYMMVRLEACKRVLNEKGSIYLHCDYRASHYLKMIMDEIFGDNHFVNEIIWSYRRWTSTKRGFQKMHDTILLYTKSNFTFNTQYEPFSQKTVVAPYKRKLENGRAVQDKDKPMTRDVTKGIAMRDVWEMPFLHPVAKERAGYPTQKPEALLERIIKASSNEGDTVLDPFCGCGTTAIMASKLNRKFIGIDIDTSERKRGELPMAFTVIKNRSHELFEQSEYITRDIDEVLELSPKPFENWVNGFFKASKPNPDKGVDGITLDNIPIQTKTFVVKDYSYVTKLIGDARYHPQVKQPFDHAIIVSQKGFGDGARQRQFEIQTKEGIKVDLLTPAMMLNGYKELTP
jgi:site-specific DNA-methyltransferase (adenine-specific)